jgi:hyperosmotically inducible periplasmic protein
MTSGGKGMLKRRVALSGVLGALLLAAPAMASDADLQKRVEDRLARAGLEERGDVHVKVRDGVVTLDGFALTVDARRDAEKAAGKESKRVESRLVVRPEVAVPDAQLRDAVADAILGEPRYGVFDSVGVGVEDGVVLLTGSVRQPWLKDSFDRRVAEVDGVREIRNEIRIAPTSIYDDRLRVQLYRQIYGDDMFVRYSNWAVPPIRIVVENGKVTLTGIVNSPVEQARLGMIARGTLAFKVTNDVEVESERSKEPARKTTES